MSPWCHFRSAVISWRKFPDSLCELFSDGLPEIPDGFPEISARVDLKGNGDEFLIKSNYYGSIARVPRFYVTRNGNENIST